MFREQMSHRQTDRQTDRETYRETERHSCDVGVAVKWNVVQRVQ